MTNHNAVGGVFGKQLMMASCCLFGFIQSQAFGQAESFKEELYDRGMALLANQERPYSPVLVESAFQTTAALYPEELLLPLVKKYKLDSEDAVRFALSVAPYSSEREYFCRFLPQINWGTDDDLLWLRSAYRLGNQNVELQSLMKDLFGVQDGVGREQQDGLGLRLDSSDSRVSVFCFAYHLGQLSGSPPAKPLSLFQRHVTDDRLKTILHAKFLATVGPQVFPLPELVQNAQENLPHFLQSRVLWQVLKSIDADALSSNTTHEFIQAFLEIYFANIDQLPGRAMEDCESVLDDLPYRLTEIFPKVSPDELLRLLCKAEWIQSASEMLDVILRFKSDEKAQSEKWFKQWIGVILGRSLEGGDLRYAEEISQRFSIPLPFPAVISYAVQNDDFGPAEAIAKSNRGTEPHQFILAAVLLEMNKPHQAKPWLDELEQSFTKRLNNQTPEKRLNWIANQIMIMGWQGATPYSDRLPLEPAITRAFESLVDDPHSKKKELLNCLGSFTPPTKASRQLLMKLFNALPATSGEPVPFEIDQLCAEISQADPQQQSKLFSDAIRLIDSLKKPDDELVSRLAFAFAVAGDQESVNAMLERIEKVEDEIWVLFQCAQAFPPRSSQLTSPRFSPRSSGGFF